MRYLHIIASFSEEQLDYLENLLGFTLTLIDSGCTNEQIAKALVNRIKHLSDNESTGTNRLPLGELRGNDSDERFETRPERAAELF